MAKTLHSKGIIQLTPLIIGLIIGVIVAGIVSGYITKKVNLGATARLIVSPLTDKPSPEVGVKF